MFIIPQHVLENLRCELCNGYLSVKPLMILGKCQQICGKCYKVLSTVEKEKCVRQKGLESLAELCVFPCRYNLLGCKHVFGWCDEKEHEKECQYRFEALSVDNDYRYSTKYSSNSLCSQDTFSVQSEDVCTSFRYDINENHRILSYQFSIKGNNDKQINITSNKFQVKEDVEIMIQGTVALQHNPKLVYTEIKLNPLIRENIYESLSYLPIVRKRCVVCKNEPRKEYTCSLGHTLCENCKNKRCTNCVKTMERQSKRFCKNYERGCTDVFSFDAIHGHEVDCIFNDVKCPLDDCSIIEMLPKLKTHFIEDHQNSIFTTNIINKSFSVKDDCFLILIYDGIFKCSYFYFKTNIEILIAYVGSSKEASNFLYYVTVIKDKISNKKKAQCSHWNNSMIESGITFQREELVSLEQKKLAFSAHIEIAYVKH